MGLDRLIGKLLPKPQREQRAVLNCRPKRNDDVGEEPLPDGGVRLRAPLLRSSIGLQALLARAARAPTSKSFELEEVGAFVWSLCDGTMSLHRMAERLRDRFKMNRLEAEASLVSFVQTLGRKGLITLLPAESRPTKAAKHGR